jgi:hypothetical protein
VLLTLLSLIQAIALEGLWSRAGESAYLYQGGVGSLAGWLQVTAIVLGILLVWLQYTTMVIRYLWAPTIRDSIFPYAIGLLEFAAIDLLGPEHPAAWMLAMASVYLVVAWAGYDILRRAERGEGGRPAAPVPASGLRYPAIAVGIHLALAAGLAASDGYGAVEAVAFGIVALLILVQTGLLHIGGTAPRKVGTSDR